MGEMQSRLGETEEQAAWYTHKHGAAVKHVDQLKLGLCYRMVNNSTLTEKRKQAKKQAKKKSTSPSTLKQI